MIVYPFSRLQSDYPQVVEALDKGFSHGRLVAHKVVPHVGTCSRRWFLLNDGKLAVETGWNNAPSDFDYYEVE